MAKLQDIYENSNKVTDDGEVDSKQREKAIDDKIVFLLNNSILPMSVAIGGSMVKPLLRIPTEIPEGLERRFESFGYDVVPEEEEKLYSIYKRVTRRVFKEHYGK